MMWSHIRRLRSVDLGRLHPSLRYISLTTIALVLLWLFIIRQGERTLFTDHIRQCDWEQWESWPENAQPHRAVLIADPQLVDAHTYPGRPWPLSSMTERYTDRYMKRSFREINIQLDPDSIIFLGDMMDGGREWAPAFHKPLTGVPKWTMETRSPATKSPPEAEDPEIVDPDWPRGVEKRAGGGQSATYAADAVVKKERIQTKFVAGEDGRWEGYDNEYWEREYNRFGKIFLSPDQVYPGTERQLNLSDYRAQAAVNNENGARHKKLPSYTMVGSKTRTLLSSLPGNHDLGFGSGVQWPIRTRYEWHFGDLSRVDVLGNHTFVSVDALSLAAWSQFESSGQQSTSGDAKDRKHIYADAQTFLDKLPQSATIKIRQVLRNLYPHTATKAQKWPQTVSDPKSIGQSTFPASVGGAKLPVVLLTHVPLYREPHTDCGPSRERGRALSITGGYQYQNVLTPTLSNTIVQKVGTIGPLSEVFSGDDHDYCNVTHEYTLGDKTGVSVVEETVKSFSWAMGVRHPGFMMVSLWNPVDDRGKALQAGRTIQTRMCLLPDQLAIFIRYASFAGLTILVLLVKVAIDMFRKQEFIDDETPAIRITDLLSSGLQKVKSLIDPDKRSKHRHRASSSALKPPTNSSLSVQRSSNARARSVSPGINFTFPLKALSDQSGTYLDVRAASNYGSDDEESRIGDTDYLDDSQGKWRSRTRPRGKLKHAWDDFVGSLSLVASIAGIYYILLIRAG